MVSLQEANLCSRKRDQMTLYGESFHGSFKRTKQRDQSQSKLDNTTLFYQRSKSENAKPDVEIHYQTSLALDWQNHLDAKGQSETYEDHEIYLKGSVSAGRPKMSLDLELNLSSSNLPVKKDECSKGGNLMSTSGDISGGGLSLSPSWLAFEGDDDNQKQEMVTTVCMKCHMLVMLCKSTLVCPNCKFRHPDDHSSTKQFEPSSLFKLL